MNLPFVGIFKKRKVGTSAGAVAIASVARIEKPASERFGKTVRPNVSRGIETSASASSPSSSSFPGSPIPATAATATAPKTVSLGANGEPAAERTIALQLADIIPQIPDGLLGVAEIDPQQRILLKASELERGMANGHPTVLLRAVYQQVPDI